MADAEHELDYELRDDGVLYNLADKLVLKVQRKSAQRVKVTMRRGNVIASPQTGDLDAPAFREKLVGLARKNLGEAADLAQELDLIAVGFEAHAGQREAAAKEHDKRTNAPELVGTPYRIVDGGIVRLKNTREGEVPQRLTNFTARVAEEVVRDDGAEARRIYRVTGTAAGGKPLPRAEVPAGSFGAMNWVSDAWGLAARITAGQGAKDYAREAIELLSNGATARHLYAHTGWRVLPDGSRAYLHAGGAIGAEGVEVELEPGLERYALPLDAPQGEALARAVKVSLRFLELAPIRVTGPLLAAAYLAPLSGIVVPDFALWLYGATGSFKSTLSALLVSHFGDFSETDLPLSFESTANANERSLFLLKDTVAVVDDWRPAVSRSDASEMDRKAQRLLRAVGNRQGRGRMTPDTALRRSYPPRGVVIATAEALPEGPVFESATARFLSMHLSRDDVDRKELSAMQRDREALKAAMAGYATWIGANYERLARELPGKREAARDRLRATLAQDAHPRTPDAVAVLSEGFCTFLSFAVQAGALDTARGQELTRRVEGGLIEAAEAHAEATSGGDPATAFVGLLRTLFAADRAYAKDRESGAQPDEWAKLGWEEIDTENRHDFVPAKNAAFVGWADAEFVYLDKNAAYAAVAGFAARGNIPFGIKPHALWKALARAGKSATDEGRSDAVARIEGKSKRVIQLPRAPIFEEEGP